LTTRFYWGNIKLWEWKFRQQKIKKLQRRKVSQKKLLPKNALKLIKGIDDGIKDAVVALNPLGYPTTNSCEGHSYGRLAPFVDMALKGEPQDEDRTADEKIF
jgi:hypothetical protein